MPVADAELRATLERVLDRPLRTITRRRNAYCSSFAVEDVEVAGDDGLRLRLVFKDLAASALAPQARAAKRTALLDPNREIEAYRDVLAPAGVDVPNCYGAVAESGSGRYWLFLEAVDGVPLWQLGAPSAWEEAARWLAGLHGRGAPARKGRLVRYDETYFQTSVERARAHSPAGSLDAVAAGWDRVVRRLATWPRTFVHGDFYPANVLVRRGAAGPRVVPVDWELAGVGPGLLDLAALTSGGWTAAQRERLALAYRDALPAADRPPTDDLLDALAHCRLYVAVQWLGCSPAWSPPAEHAHDWLADARSLAEELSF